MIRRTSLLGSWIALFAVGGLWSQDATSAEPAASDAVAKIEALGYRPVLTPHRPIELGGLIVPGSEVLGTAHSALVSKVLATKRQPTKALSWERVRWGSVGAIFPRAAAVSKSCRDSDMQIVGINETRLTLEPAQFQKDEGPTARLSSALGLKPSELEGYVIVTSTLTPTVVVENCNDERSRKEVANEAAKTTVGYRGGTDRPSSGAVGEPNAFKILKMFELGQIADRALVVRSIESLPPGVEVGYRSIGAPRSNRSRR
jgi:hypothetical protein